MAERNGVLPTSDETYLRDMTDAERLAAGLTVAEQIDDRDEIAMLLEMLGLDDELRRIRS